VQTERTAPIWNIRDKTANNMTVKGYIKFMLRGNTWTAVTLYATFREYPMVKDGFLRAVMVQLGKHKDVKRFILEERL